MMRKEKLCKNFSDLTMERIEKYDYELQVKSRRNCTKILSDLFSKLREAEQKREHKYEQDLESYFKESRKYLFYYKKGANTLEDRIKREEAIDDILFVINI